VFVHELGHFLAARLVGIDVLAFSLGWGKPIIKKKIGSVEYRVGILPVGGYCSMRGENEFEEAWNNKLKAVPATQGSFFGAAPWRRIVVAFAGPFFNFLFAAVVFAFVWGFGFTFQSFPARIVLASDITPPTDGKLSPAAQAGLKTGDTILEINGHKVDTYRDIQELIALHAIQTMPLVYERNGQTHETAITPALDKETGAGRIGVYNFAEPVIGAITPNSPADRAGLRKGDVITAVNGQPVPYTVALYRLFPADKPFPASIRMQYRTGSENGALRETTLAIPDSQKSLGIAWQVKTYRTPRYNLFGAVGKGCYEAWRTVAVTVRSFSLLFKGIDLTKAVSGPVRITWMLGDVAAEGFSRSVSAGLRSAFDFLALISIALGVTNLLPLPVLDGGLIVLFLIECLRRQPTNPRVIGALNAVGMVLIVGLMVFALFGDVLFLAKG
jgi:regulator of sigma E protease